MTKLMFDYDPLLYACGSIGEKRSIKVVHRKSGDEHEFPTRTAFYGHWKAKKGGWLAEYNEGRKVPRLAEEFDIEDIQEAEPITHCIHTLKKCIVSAKESVGASSYYGYSGVGKVFREDVSTIVKYKGNREGLLKPVHLDGLKEYLVKNHACKIVQTVEADDWCSMDSYAAWQKWKLSKSDSDKLVLCAVDKDYKGTASHLLHSFELGAVDSYDGFGFLSWDVAKKEVKGRGRMWLYFQVMNGDTSDNYFANSASSMKWADKSAYDILKDAKNDKEAFEALVKGYKLLYPQPKKIIGWRGYEDPKTMKILKPNAQDFEIEIDWLYVLQENFTLAHMLRKLDDKVDVKAVMNKLGVNFDDNRS